MRRTAEHDGPGVAVWIERDGGGAGKALADRYTREVLRGFDARAELLTGDKFVRAQPVAAAAENGYFRIVHGRNAPAFLDEVISFPNGRDDDCVDALSGAHRRVTRLPRPGRRTSVPRGRIPGAAPWRHSSSRPGWPI